MLISKTIKIGKRPYHIWGNGNDPWEAVMDLENASFYSVGKCGACGSDNLKLKAYKAQGQYKYLQVRCLECKATLTCGSRKDNPNLYYYRRNDDGTLQWEEYKEQNSQTPEGQKPAEEHEQDDLPF